METVSGNLGSLLLIRCRFGGTSGFAHSSVRIDQRICVTSCQRLIWSHVVGGSGGRRRSDEKEIAEGIK